MTVTAAPTFRPVRPTASAPVAGGEAWIVPAAEPGAHPWVSVAAPAIRVIDQRAAKRR